MDEAVRAVQRALVSDGFSVGPTGPDGIMGANTRKAIRSWQQLNGLEATGIVDSQTHKRMFGTALRPQLTMPWMVEARRYMGLREIPGKAHNQTIVGWLKALKATWLDDETPWCGTLVGYCFLAALPAEPLPANPFGARQWQKFGIACEPTEGCVLVFSRPGSAWSGHVGFYVGESNTHFYVLGGNQSNSVNVSPISKNRLLGARWPKTVPLGPTKRVSMTGGKATENEA